jgi:demethylmenaquinone methyltransferase/2-methoxy-6-polyprenyl-1,4-benzoquinol methylase
MAPPPPASREAVREARLGDVWSNDLNDVFADVAPYYDRANNIAALGQFGNFLRRFMQLVELKPQQKVLDVCAGTNAIGIALLKREPTLDVHAIDRSAAMQTVGQQRAAGSASRSRAPSATCTSCPFPDLHFDIVTLQFASRHLRVREVFSEILRVLKPGGHFHHSDMLRRA